MIIANAPVSWGVYEADRPNPPYARVLDAIASAGYVGTELGPYGYLPVDPAELRAVLAARGLRLGSSFVALPLEDEARRAESLAHALRVARLLSSQGVGELIVADDEDPARARIAGRVSPDGRDGWDAAAWGAAVETLHGIARAVREETGLGLVVHHHAGTFVETPGEIRELLDRTDPERVGLLLDTGHAAYGGADPVRVVREHGDRIRYVHLKDVSRPELDRVRAEGLPMADAWRRGVFCPLGEGMVDFASVVQALRERGFRGWMVVEQDVVPDEQGRLRPDPTESARKSREYLRRELGL